MWFSPMGISPLVLYCPPFKKWTALSIDCHRRYPCHHKLCSLLYPSRKTCPCYRSILLPCSYSFPSRISILSYSPLQLPPPYQTTSPPTHPITKPDFFPVEVSSQKTLLSIFHLYWCSWFPPQSTYPNLSFSTKSLERGVLLKTLQKIHSFVETVIFTDSFPSFAI